MRRMHQRQGLHSPLRRVAVQIDIAKLHRSRLCHCRMQHRQPVRFLLPAGLAVGRFTVKPENIQKVPRLGGKVGDLFDQRLQIVVQNRIAELLQKGRAPQNGVQARPVQLQQCRPDLLRRQGLRHQHPQGDTAKQIASRHGHFPPALFRHHRQRPRLFWSFCAETVSDLDPAKAVLTGIPLIYGSHLLRSVQACQEGAPMTELTPREIVSELDRIIIGQKDAKRAVAVALRNRWRRKQLPDQLRDEVHPKNILMIGPTGVGKTEISRRLARLARAPFIKIEATKFTEVGYVGRDVEQIIRDLVDSAIAMTREHMREDVRANAHTAAEERVITAIAGEDAREGTRDMFRKKLKSGELDDTIIELDVADTSNPLGMMDIPGQPGAGQMGMMNLGDIFGKAFSGRTKRQKMTVAESYDTLVGEEADKLLDDETVTRAAIEAVEQNGIVFLDEIDKVCTRAETRGGDVSREGVQRDLLPLIEGTTVSTKYGPVKTDHVLFIASGAFHVAKPSDLLPELQGRLPIRVELRALTEEDFVRILTETDNALTLQYEALMGTENVKVTFTQGGINAIARIAAEVNQSVENIGARRLYTVMERVFEEISFTAPDRSGEAFDVDAKFVEDNLGELAKSSDLSRYVL